MRYVESCPLGVFYVPLLSSAAQPTRHLSRTIFSGSCDDDDVVSAEKSGVGVGREPMRTGKNRRLVYCPPFLLRINFGLILYWVGSDGVGSILTGPGR